MYKISIQIFVFLTFGVFLTAMAKAPEWYVSLPRFEQPPHDADELLGMQSVSIPIDTINKYIEQKANYGKGTLTHSFECFDALVGYDVYGVYETDSLSMLYYRTAYTYHDEIKTALNPFAVRYPSTLILYWNEYDEYSLPSIRFNCEEGIFTVITKVRPGELIWETEVTYAVNLPSNRFNRLSYAHNCYDEDGNPPEWFKDGCDTEEEDEIRVEIWPTSKDDE